MNKHGATPKSLVLALDFLGYVAGAFIYAIGLVCFLKPANIAPGGVSGITIILNYIWEWIPLGTANLIINIPLIILAWFYLGKRFTIKTLVALALSSFMTDLVVTPLFPIYAGDRLLGSVFGGVLVGVGLGLIFWRGATTGGTEIVSGLLRLKFPQVSMGKALMLVDCAVLASSMLVFKNLESGLYGIIALFVISKAIDLIVYGVDQGNMVTVVSDKNPEITKRILEELDRGVTLLSGKGGYTGQEREVLICAVRKSEFARLKSIIREEDHNAFVVTTEAGEILGQGFKPVNK